MDNMNNMGQQDRIVRPNIAKPVNNTQHQNNVVSQIIGTRDNIDVIFKQNYQQFGLDVEIIQYRELKGSTNINAAQALWFMSQENIRCRQIGIEIHNSGVKIESGAMSYFQGNLQCSTGITSAGKFMSQMFTGKLTGEKIIMPEYKGSGLLVLEPSFKHFLPLLLEQGEQIICDKGMFYAASTTVTIEPTFAGGVSGSLLGGEGIFQQLITGPGVVILESPVPMCEINKIQLNNDTLRVDGNFALLRTGGINMNVEPVSQSLVGSAASGEGLVNVFRGTGEVWIAPTIKAYDAINIARSLGGDVTNIDMNTSTGRARVK